MIERAIDAAEEEDLEQEAIVIASAKRRARRCPRRAAVETGCVPPSLRTLRNTSELFRMARLRPERLADYLEKVSFDERVMEGSGAELFAEAVRREFQAKARFFYRLAEKVGGDPLRMTPRVLRPIRRPVRRARRSRRVARSTLTRAGPDTDPPPADTPPAVDEPVGGVP